MRSRRSPLVSIRVVVGFEYTATVDLQLVRATEVHIVIGRVVDSVQSYCVATSAEYNAFTGIVDL